MGILTSVLTNLANELVDLGVGQLDAYVTKEIQEGRTENALQKMDEWENRVAQNYGLANKVVGGEFNMPGLDLGGGRGVLPTSPEGQVYMSAFSNLPPIPKEIENSPVAYNTFSSLYSNALENNPANIQREIQSEAQKNRIGLVKDLTKEGFQQNQMGFQEALGAFDQPGSYDLPREERLRRSQERQFGQTTAQYQAAEPYKIAASQRSIQFKQTPGARAIGTGGGDNKPGAGMPTAALNQIDKMLAQEGKRYGEATYDGMLGNLRFQPNEAGRWIKQRANQIFVEQGKTKNFLKAYNQAKGEWNKQQRDITSQMPPKPSGLQTKSSLPTQGPQPTAKQKASEITQPPKVSHDQMLKAVTNAKNAGESDEFIRRMIQSKGYRPEDFGYSGQVIRKRSPTQIAEGIARAKQVGESSAKIRQRIIEEGYDPRDFGYRGDKDVWEKINILESREISDQKIKDALKTDGLNPADYGFAP